MLRLAKDLVSRLGRGFSKRNLDYMRAFYLNWEIVQTPSEQFEARVKRPTLSKESTAEKVQTLSAESPQAPVRAHTLVQPGVALADAFPLSWSQYVRLMSVEKPQARAFYESEAIRGGWSVRQLDRQISTQFYERAVRSKHAQALLARGQMPKEGDAVSVAEEVRDPYLLEFLNLKDEYSETELEEALIRHLEWFLLELGTGFTFVARQKRVRVGDSWYRIDLLLYHRGLRCLVIIDLKTGAFTHADAGQMNLYLNYAREHLKLLDEADPVGIILCTDKDDAVVKYATGGIRTKVFASKYLTSLPDEETLRSEILTTQRAIRARLKGEQADG
jgi:predicted nuclease of restriction endonuclease-like (RecB) superfamily